MNEQLLRDRLSSLAAEVPQQSSVPPGLIRRARRHAVLVVGAAAACLALIVVGATAGVRSLLRAEPSRPAVTGPIFPGPGGDDRITVVLATSGGAPGGAVLIDPEGEAAARTELRLGRNAFPLAWSADGRDLVFSDVSATQLNVFADGRVTTLLEGGSFVGASWSPQGDRIVFGSGPPFEASLHVIEADGSGEQVLLPSTERDWFLFPAWSPDGSRIAFMRGDATLSGCPRNCDRGARLWVMDADGTSARPLITDVNFGARSHTPPVWSPDGSRIAFSAYVGEWGSDVEIFVAQADGSDVVQLTRGPGPATAPAWAPDGTRIAFLRPVDGGKEIWLIDAEGMNERRMPAVPLVFDNSAVLWSRTD